MLRNLPIFGFVLWLAAIIIAAPAVASDQYSFPIAKITRDNIDNLPKWERILDFYEQTNLENPSAEYREWWNFIREVKEYPAQEQIEIVNNALNDFPYGKDSMIYKRQDYWASPTEFLKYGGDCEDFAIIKYMTLRRLGFRPDQLKITMVYDNKNKIDHSFLVVDYGKKSFVMDSREKSMNPNKFKIRYEPHYAFNEKQLWAFHSPKLY